jgi:predicted nuclease with TOPRIM domain
MDDAPRKWRDEAFADLVTMTLALAAERNQLELRKALGSVFDTAAIEHATEDIRTKLQNLWTTYEEFRAKLNEQEQQIDRNTLALEKLETALARARANWGQLVARGAKRCRLSNYKLNPGKSPNSKVSMTSTLAADETRR